MPHTASAPPWIPDRFVARDMAWAPTALTDAQTAGLARLGKFYTAQDVIDVAFDGDADAFIQAWCAGGLPPAVWTACEQNPGQVDLNRLLLRRIVVLLSAGGRPGGR